ncbi:hypothetical protein Hanom_Chr01g00051711 [Helianthus anomalus]
MNRMITLSQIWTPWKWFVAIVTMVCGRLNRDVFQDGSNRQANGTHQNASQPQAPT